MEQANLRLIEGESERLLDIIRHRQQVSLRRPDLAQRLKLAVHMNDYTQMGLVLNAFRAGEDARTTAGREAGATPWE